MQQVRWSRSALLKGLLSLCLVVVLLALAYGALYSDKLPKAYAEGPAGANGQNWSTGPASQSAQPVGQISYQGRLLQNDSPYNGNIQITFKLYGAASGGSVWWSETQTVNVNQGLFTVMLGAVTPLPVTSFNSQAWLGIQPAGAASELTPRQQLGAAPYAMSLIPGATVSDSSSPGGYTASFWVDGRNHVGVYAASSYTGTSALQGSASGNNSHAVAASYSGNSTSCPQGAVECASAVYAQSTGDAYGVYVNSVKRSALIITGTSSYWDIYDQNSRGELGAGIWTGGKLNVGGYATFGGGKSGFVVDIALNDDSVPLEQGDVVVISGFAAPVVGEIPVPRVMRATTANSTGVMGVVDSLYVVCDPSRELDVGEVCGGFEPEIGVIQPGQYLSVVTLGAYKAIKVDAAAGPIHPGDLLATTAATGTAMKATQIQLASAGVQFYAPGTIIGKALGGLDQGSGVIPVFVSAR